MLPGGLGATVRGIPASSGTPHTWRDGPTTAVCAPGEVHVWRTTDGDEPRGQALLDVLGRYLPAPVGPAQIDRTCRHCGHPTHGRPRLADGHEPALEFSVSRAGRLVVVAVTTGAVVGLDVEALDGAGDWASVAEHFFTAGEQARLDRMAEARRASAFLTAWTVKEACLKADGRGLVAGLDSVEVLLEPEQPETAPAVVSDPPWHVATFAAGPGHLAAVASDRPIHAVTGWDRREPMHR